MSALTFLELGAQLAQARMVVDGLELCCRKGPRSKSGRSARKNLARLQRIRADAFRYPADPIGYAERVRELEREGMTTSDAQGCADVEFSKAGGRAHD